MYENIILAFKFNTENVMTSLDIMWKGMLGIFVVLMLIAAVVLIIGKLDTKKEQ